MLEAGEVTIPSPGVGSLSKQTFNGTFSHPSFYQGEELDISISLLWGAGKRELQQGIATYESVDDANNQFNVRVRQDGVFFSICDDANRLEFYGKFSNVPYHADPDDEGADFDMFFKGEVRKAGKGGGTFDMGMQEEALKCTVDVALASNHTGNWSDSYAALRPLTAPISPLRGGGSPKTPKTPGLGASGSLPSLTATVSSLSSVRKRTTQCASKNCPCQFKPHSTYGFFIDRCFASRVSDWLPKPRDAK
jgi:hypothetical protein